MSTESLSFCIGFLYRLQQFSGSFTTIATCTSSPFLVAFTSIVYVWCVLYYTGMDVSPNSGSLSGGTILSLHPTNVSKMNSVEYSSVAVNIGGIPCDVISGYAMHACTIRTYVRTLIIL